MRSIKQHACRTMPRSLQLVSARVRNVPREYWRCVAARGVAAHPQSHPHRAYLHGACSLLDPCALSLTLVQYVLVYELQSSITPSDSVE